MNQNYNPTQPPPLAKGFTLVELMVTIAILAILAAIAIPAYNGYLREARFSTAQQNMQTLRIFLEDYRLENGTYVGPSAGTPTPADDTPTMAELEDDFGWTPDGDKGLFTYTVNLHTDTYEVSVQEVADSTLWVRCENRMTNCCDSDTPGATILACP